MWSKEAKPSQGQRKHKAKQKCLTYALIIIIITNYVLLTKDTKYTFIYVYIHILYAYLYI